MFLIEKPQEERVTMEGVSKTGGVGGGCEVRRIHIIYFLSHMGRIEHPHLIRVHHLHRKGVYLRDVKRWLADLRSKDMPESFAWSYKRRYKNGYVWQDLLDDDLITPISDNEYVIKGSQIFIPNHHQMTPDLKRKSVSKEDDSPVKDEVGLQPQQTSPVEDTIKPGYAKTPEIYKETQVLGSSDRSTLTDDSTRREECAAIEDDSTEGSDKFEKLSSSSFYASLLNNKSKNKGNSNKSRDSMSTTNTSFLKESPISKSSKSNSMGASNMFRNFITCGGDDTNDAVLVSINRDNKVSSNQSTTDNNNKSWSQQKQNSSRRRFESKKQHHQQKENGFHDPKVVRAAYKPVGGPTCSQCGKIFKPEKMHSHMKSCSGMKALAKTARVSTEKKTLLQGQDDSFYEECNSGYFLTN